MMGDGQELPEQLWVGASLDGFAASCGPVSFGSAHAAIKDQRAIHRLDTSFEAPFGVSSCGNKKARAERVHFQMPLDWVGWWRHHSSVRR